MKYRVLHLIRKKSQLKSSFIQNQILNHIDFEPFVVFRFNNSKNSSGFVEINEDNLNLLDLSDSETFPDRLCFFLFKRISKRQSKVLLNYINKNEINILHFHYGSDAGIYVPLLKVTKLPSVVSFYGYDCSGFPKRTFGLGNFWLKKRVFRFVFKVLAMSPDMKRDLIELGCHENKIILQYHGVDVHKFKSIHKYYNVDNLIKFLIISGLVPKKGHKFLLKSFVKAYEKNNNIRLTIIGKGPLFEEISGFIKKNNLEEIVELIGPVIYGSQEHIEYFNSHDVFVHPSVTDKNGDKEGIPGAIIEAMAAGLPVISTYHAGIPYIIENEITGLLVKEWDINALSEAIIKMADSQYLREKLGKAGQEYALTNLDLKNKEIDLENIYYTII
ncbi:MAG TPA: glycosyltransferase [Bacteroidales bacterium]|nr:hypothetical protein [Bacteroidales bacterium]HRC88526.1 glycosyltransferase [Bacteroidales bacterium]